MRGVKIGVIVVLAACVLASASTARADTVPYADDGLLPWATDTTALALFAANVESQIAGKQVQAHCVDETTWGYLGGRYGFDPGPTAGVSIVGSTVTVLAPAVCLALQEFALATTKPTQCDTTAETYVYKTIYVSKRVPKRIRVPLKKKVDGKLKVVGYRWKRVVRTVRVPQRVLDTVTVPGIIAPAYQDGALSDCVDADSYLRYATALETLAHEAMHLAGFRDEAQAECYGMQNLAYVAYRFGTTADDAVAIASWYAEQYYPARQQWSPAYWSPLCTPDGPWDIRPDKNWWP